MKKRKRLTTYGALIDGTGSLRDSVIIYRDSAAEERAESALAVIQKIKFLKSLLPGPFVFIQKKSHRAAARAERLIESALIEITQ